MCGGEGGTWRWVPKLLMNNDCVFQGQRPGPLSDTAVGQRDKAWEQTILFFFFYFSVGLWLVFDVNSAC